MENESLILKPMKRLDYSDTILDVTRNISFKEKTNSIKTKCPEELVREFQKLSLSKNYKKIGFIYMKCYIYFEQDLNCCNDDSCIDGIMNIQNFIFDPFLKKHEKEFKKILTNENLLKIAQNIKKETENDHLHSPIWIEKYGSDFSIPNKNSNMKNQDQWKIERLLKIESIINELNDSKNSTDLE